MSYPHPHCPEGTPDRRQKQDTHGWTYQEAENMGLILFGQAVVNADLQCPGIGQHGTVVSVL